MDQLTLGHNRTERARVIGEEISKDKQRTRNTPRLAKSDIAYSKGWPTSLARGLTVCSILTCGEQHFLGLLRSPVHAHQFQMSNPNSQSEESTTLPCSKGLEAQVAHQDASRTV